MSVGESGPDPCGVSHPYRLRSSGPSQRSAVSGSVQDDSHTSAFGPNVSVSILGPHKCVATTVGGNTQAVSRCRLVLTPS